MTATSPPEQAESVRGYASAITAALAVCTAIAAAAFWPVYETPRFLVMAATTISLGSAIAIVGARFRLSASSVALCTLVVFLVAGVPLAVPDRAAYGILPTLEGLRDLALGAVFGWKQLLTILLPVGEFEALLVPAFLLILVVVTVSLSTALRARRRELAVLGPILLFLCALAFGGSTAFHPLILALALIATVFLALKILRLSRARMPAERGTGRSGEIGSAGGEAHRMRRAGSGAHLSWMRPIASMAVVLAIAGAGAIAATAALPPEGSRETLRSRIAQPFDPREYASPLSGFRRYLQGANPTAPMLTIDGLEPGARIRLATLDSYDGVVYSVGGPGRSGESASFALVPNRLDQSAAPGDAVEVDVTIGGYSGVWLPSVGAMEAVEFSGPDATAHRSSFYYNGSTGTAVVVGELAEGDRYRLSALQPDELGEQQLSQFEPGSARIREAGARPAELSGVLEEYVAGVTGSGQRLSAAMEALRSNGVLSHGVSADEPTSPSGHSANRIDRLLTASPMIGDEEQFAVAGALMAQELGFPARVVVGFRPVDVVSGQPTVVTGSDISAWIEVETAQAGWVSLDPTPPERGTPPTLVDEAREVIPPRTPAPPIAEKLDPPSKQHPADAETDSPTAPDPITAALLSGIRAAGWVALAFAVLLSPFVGIVAAKARRRHLRRRGSPRARISGGWEEFEDVATDHGHIPASASTRSEFAALVGGPTSLELAVAADRAAFSPSRPDAAEADRVWRFVDDLTAALDGELTRWQRIRSMVSIRSLAGDVPKMRPVKRGRTP